MSVTWVLAQPEPWPVGVRAVTEKPTVVDRWCTKRPLDVASVEPPTVRLR